MVCGTRKIRAKVGNFREWSEIYAKKSQESGSFARK